MLQSTSVTRSISGLLATVLALCALLPVAAAPALAHKGLLPAPYQIDGLVRFKSDRTRLNDGLDLEPRPPSACFFGPRMAGAACSGRATTPCFVEAKCPG